MENIFTQQDLYKLFTCGIEWENKFDYVKTQHLNKYQMTFMLNDCQEKIETGIYVYFDQQIKNMGDYLDYIISKSLKYYIIDTRYFIHKFIRNSFSNLEQTLKKFEKKNKILEKLLDDTRNENTKISKDIETYFEEILYEKEKEIHQLNLSLHILKNKMEEKEKEICEINVSFQLLKNKMDEKHQDISFLLDDSENSYKLILLYKETISVMETDIIDLIHTKEFLLKSLENCDKN